ncbi:stemmadenine O-acetyltransferase-like [Salvia hispanica]|uniref:stemmadenine O-acetyltransferase-like n=1 Tax=Salvia hispanica TaxID=49212 RepID=UPI0020091962|nr:stemmadenine O-acetyltransferase-like [Salvia hispanica]
MEIESRVISIETITPSSSTPKSLQKYQFSFFDQIAIPSLVHVVYLYPSNPKISNSEKSKQLKKSLSEVLTIYYPLAGRIGGNLYVDCNDAGIPFSEAEADCDLSEVITTRNPINLKKKFLPLTTDNDLCLAVQATYLRCGGLAVGISITHKIADGISIILFVNTWSALARDAPASLVKLDSATYAPPLDIILESPCARLLDEEVTASNLLFSAPEIAALQERYTAGGGRRPSRVEALTAFIWTSYVSAVGIRGHTCIVSNAVSLRSRADPPLSAHQFGNFVVPSTVEAVPGDSGVQLIRKMREALKAVDAEFVAGLKKREMQLEVLSSEASRAAAVDTFFFSSLCRFPYYEADYGWGTPDRVIRFGMAVKNAVYFMDTKSGGGIEALIKMTKPDMDKLEPLLMLKSELL